jgi:hypothetical protein
VTFQKVWAAATIIRLEQQLNTIADTPESLDENYQPIAPVNL